MSNTCYFNNEYVDLCSSRKWSVGYDWGSPSNQVRLEFRSVKEVSFLEGNKSQISLEVPKGRIKPRNTPDLVVKDND